MIVGSWQYRSDANRPFSLSPICEATDLDQRVFPQALTFVVNFWFTVVPGFVELKDGVAGSHAPSFGQLDWNA